MITRTAMPLITFQMEDALKKRVVGQDHVVGAVSDAVRISRAGLQAPNRPVASMMFLGPTGVGKVARIEAPSDNVNTLAPTRPNSAKRSRLSYLTMNREDCKPRLTFPSASQQTVSVLGSTSTCPR